MTLKTQIASDMSTFYNTDEYAETVGYTSRNASPAVPTDISAIIDYGQGDEYQGADTYGVRATLRVQVSELAQPAKGDVITIGSDDWRIIGADLSADGLEWIIGINRETI